MNGRQSSDVRWLGDMQRASIARNFWTPVSVAEQQEAAGKLVIVLWTDPDGGQQYSVVDDSMPGAVLTAFRGQWDEALRVRHRKI